MENEEGVLLRQLMRNQMQKVHFHGTSHAKNIYFFYIYNSDQLNIVYWVL